MESGEVTIEIYRGNELKSVKQGKGNFWIKFGTDKKKYQTGKVSDPLGFPVWNTTAAIPVTSSTKNIKLKAMDGDKCVGQLTIPLSQIARAKLDATPQDAALQPHRQCSHPSGSLSFLCYYTRFIEVTPASGRGSTMNLAAQGNGGAGDGDKRLSGFGLMPPALSGSVQSLSKRSGGGVLGKLKQAMAPIGGKQGSMKRKDSNGDTNTLRASAKTLSFSTYDMRSMSSPKVGPGARKSQPKVGGNRNSQHSDDEDSINEWSMDLEGASANSTHGTAHSNTSASHSIASASATASQSNSFSNTPFTSDLPPKAPASTLRVSNSMNEATSARPKPVVAIGSPSPSHAVKTDNGDGASGLMSLASFRMPKDVERIAESGEKFQTMPHVRRRAQPIIGDDHMQVDDGENARPTAQSLAERLRNNRASQVVDMPSSVITPPRSESTLLSLSMNDGQPPSNVSSRQNSLSRDAMRRPQVMSCEPSEGTIQGGTSVTIRGVNLGSSDTDIVAVYVCGANCRNTLTYVSNAEIRVVTKAWRECTGFIVVETKTGGRSNSAVQFTYKDYSKVQVLPSPSPSPHLSRRNDATRSSILSKASNESAVSLGGHLQLAANASSNNTNASVSSSVPSATATGQAPAAASALASASAQPTSQAQTNSVSSASGSSQKGVSDVALEMASENTRLRQKLLEAEQSVRKLQTDNTALKSYIDQLLERIIVKCPEILCIPEGEMGPNDKVKKRST